MGNAGAYSPCDSASNDGSLSANWWKFLTNSSGKLLLNNVMVETWLTPEASPNYLQLRQLGTAWYNYWDKYADLINTAQSLGAGFTGESAGQANSITQPPRYERATLLLNWDGTSYSSVMNVPSPSADSWYNGSWEIDLGQPAGAKTQVGSAWKRIYAKGEVIVNPTSSAVSIDGHTIGAADAYIGP